MDLQTSLMSRVTAVLPFVPFSREEKLAIAAEAVAALAAGQGEGAEAGGAVGLGVADDAEAVGRLAERAVGEYVRAEGARALYRSVATYLMEMS